MKKIVFTIFIMLLCINFIEGNALGDMNKAIGVVNNAKTILEKVNEIIIKTNPGKLFAQVSKVLVTLGPAMMAVSAFMSIIAIFLPQEPSAELKAINAGFEKVNRKLDVITSEIRDLKNIVELSSAKSAYIKCVTAINKNYETFEEAKKENKKESYDYFVRQYEMTYDLAASNLYDAMTGKLGPFGFNLVNLYKDYVKCNPVLVSKFCTLGMQLLIKGIAVEGGYLGSLNLTEKVNAKKNLWEKEMETLGQSCTEVIKSCEDNWKVMAAQHFRETYKKEMTDNNQNFAKKISNSLNEIVPQRGWFVISYNDASGFSDHVYDTFYESDKIWNENKLDVTIFSTPFEEKIKDADYVELKNKIDNKRTQAASMKDCKMAEWKTDKKVSYDKYDLRPLVNFVRDVFKKGVIYIVPLDKNPGYAATGNTLYASELEWKCAGKKYSLLLFV